MTLMLLVMRIYPGKHLSLKEVFQTVMEQLKVVTHDHFHLLGCVKSELLYTGGKTVEVLSEKWIYQG